MKDFIVASAAYDIVKGTFSQNNDVAEKCFRLKNFLPSEVTQFIRVWDINSTKDRLDSVRLVVSNQLGTSIPEKYLAEDGNTITYYRNNNPHGLVFIETQPQSDAQGLQNIFTLRDSNFLDNSFDRVIEKLYGVAQLILSQTWNSHTKNASSVPIGLVSVGIELLEHLKAVTDSISVRKFVCFAEELATSWFARKEAVDASIGDILAGAALWQLGLFPDPEWRQSTPQKTRRRLQLNGWHADLTNGQADLDTAELERAVKLKVFRGLDNEPLSAGENSSFKSTCTKYLLSGDASTRREIPYRIFEQLFVQDTKGLKLGDRVGAEIRAYSDDRFAEFLELDIAQGLNSKSQYDAERFLDSPAPSADVPALVDVISSKTRRMVERLAAPPARRFFNPAIELVRLVQQAQLDHNKVPTIEIGLAPSSNLENPSIGLFAFLFGNLLNEISQNLSDDLSGAQVVVDPALVEVPPPPPLQELCDEVGDFEALAWEPVPLRFAISSPEGVIATEVKEWEPRSLRHFALTWLICSDKYQSIWENVGAFRYLDTDYSVDWIDSLVQRVQSLQIIQPISPQSSELAAVPLLQKTREARQSFACSVGKFGLSTVAINEYFDRWFAVLMEARALWVPQGRRIPEMDALISADLIAFDESSRRTMLPTHPLRLRWVSAYFAESVKLATSFLTGHSRFIMNDGERYLNWLEKRSPHETPPVILGDQNEFQFSKGEIGWFESYSSAQSDLAVDGVDRGAITSIVARIHSYLDAHPYKSDGLTMLVILPPSDDFVSELIAAIASGYWKNCKLSVTIAAPKARWERIARHVESGQVNLNNDSTRVLFPPVDLMFVDFEKGQDIGAKVDGAVYDLSLVTHLLQESITLQQNTEAAVERPGRFLPLRDRPVSLEASLDGGAIALAMRPRDPDDALEAWSTLIVRANRTRPVAIDQEQNIDFIELRVNFEDSARLFNRLHQCSQWVLTLERHITRQQIESLEAGAPDILSVEYGVGNNELSTLIVSSRSGRELIESRLVRKMDRLVGGHNETLLKQLANRIYDETRRLAPHLALKAMGVSRVTEEILGLAVARSVTEEREPLSSEEVGIWLSLDEYASWFSGSAVRADLCRLTWRFDESEVLNLKVVVVEGKLRQVVDLHGIAQVKQSLEFFKMLLAEGTASTPTNIDSGLWREMLTNAIESSSPEAWVAGEGANAKLTESAREAFREGKFVLSAAHGIYSICQWNNLGSNIEVEVNGEITVVRSSNSDLVSLVTRPLGDETKRAVTRDFSSNSSTANEPTSNSSSQTEPEIATAASPAKTPEAQTLTPKSEVYRATNNVRMSHAELKAIYENLLQCFTSQGVQVHAAQASDQPIIEGPASILFKVKLGIGVDPRRAQEKGAAIKLALELDNEQNVSFGIDKGFVTVDVPKKAEQRYFVSADTIWKSWTRRDGSLAAPIGEDRFGNVVELDFSSANSPHLLIGGTTGSGKSEALNTILYGLVKHYSPSELRLLLVDPKGTELQAFGEYAHTMGDIAWDGQDAIAMLSQAVEEMERRYQLLKSLKCRSLAEYNVQVDDQTQLPWWLVVLDEYADLTHEPQVKKDLEAELRRLAQKARAAGIHVIIATQKPSAEVISTNLRSNLPAQLALRVKSAIESRVIMDEAGAEALNGKGDAILKSNGKLIRVQCAKA